MADGKWKLKRLSLRDSVAALFCTAILLAAILPISSANAEDEKTILWLYPDFPPIYIQEGPDAGTGLGDQVLDYFMEHLPQYHHVEGISNFKRIIKTLASGKNACGITLLKNDERAKVVEFTERFMLAPQNEIITLKSHLKSIQPLMDEDGTVSLAELLEKTPLSLGYSLGRSYSALIDQVVREKASKKNSHMTSGANILEGLMKMLQYKRIDYTIGYGYEARYLAGKSGFKDDVVAIPIRENPGYVDVHAGCPKTPWGRKVVARLNEIIKTAKYDPRIVRVYEKWLDPDSFNRYLKAVTRLFEKHPAGAS